MSYINTKDINLFLGKVYGQVKKTAQFPLPKKKKPVEPKRNIILIVGELYGHMIDAIKAFDKKQRLGLRIGFLHDSKRKLDDVSSRHLEKLDLLLSCDLTSDMAIQKTLLVHQKEILVATCRAERRMAEFARVLPHLPYIDNPTTESLAWSTDKIGMRAKLHVFDPTVNPAFALLEDDAKKSVDDVVERVGFPMVVKPSGFAASRLVSICYHKEELEEVLKKIFRKMNTAQRSARQGWESRVLVEHFMEGDMYSIDAYVNRTGKVYTCPMVEVRTGRSIGFDDFFGYQQITPTLLKPESIREAEAVAAQAIRGVGLKSTTVHIELMRMEEGWKIIEMGPRMGGFRHMMYEHSTGMNHVANDILNKMGKKPAIPQKTKAYTVAMKFFARQEGRLAKLIGIKKAEDLKSTARIWTHKKIGDMCSYAKHGGSSVFDILLVNKERSDVLADIRRLEQMIQIETN